MRFLRGERSKVRIVLTADIHIGRSRFGSPDQTHPSLRHRQALSNVVRHCAESDADALLIAGDLFDSPSPNPDDLAHVAQDLTELKTAGLFVGAIAGDADQAPAGSISTIGLFDRLGLLIDLEKPDAAEHSPVQFGDLQLAISTVKRAQGLGSGDGLLGDLDRRTGADFHILIGHYAVEGLGGTNGSGPSINLDSVNALMGVDALVCGHVHATNHDVFGETTVIVPGSPVGAADACGFVAIDLSARGIENIDLLPGIVHEPVEVLVQASQLQPDHAVEYLRMVLRPKLEPDSEVLLRIAGRLDDDSFREARLAELSLWASSLCARFSLDLDGLRVGDGSDAGRAQESISPFEEVRRSAAEAGNREGSDPADIQEAADLVMKSLRAEFGS